MGERLQKVLARGGWGSRRTCEQLIAAGLVTVNGERVTQPGTVVDIATDSITLQGKELELERIRTLLFYKPSGVVTTLHDPQRRSTVADFFRAIPERLYPVGRLDQDTEGLLLFTNDGALAHELSHPRYGCPKIYEVTVAGRPNPGALRLLAAGIMLDDGVTAPAILGHEELVPQGMRVQVTLREGRKRQIRRMFAAIGHEVVHLVRIQIGSVVADGLAPGSYRELTPEEVAGLRQKNWNV